MTTLESYGFLSVRRLFITEKSFLSKILIKNFGQPEKKKTLTRELLTTRFY